MKNHGLKPNAHGLITAFFGCPGCLKPGRKAARIVQRSSSGKPSRVRVRCKGCGEMKPLSKTTGC